MALDTTAKHYGAINFAMPFMLALSLPDASNLNTELERSVFLRLSPDVDPSAGGGTGTGAARRCNLMQLGMGL